MVMPVNGPGENEVHMKNEWLVPQHLPRYRMLTVAAQEIGGLVLDHSSQLLHKKREWREGGHTNETELGAANASRLQGTMRGQQRSWCLPR